MNAGVREIASGLPQRQLLRGPWPGLRLMIWPRSQHRVGRLHARALSPLPLETDQRPLLRKGCRETRTPRRLKDSSAEGRGCACCLARAVGDYVQEADGHTRDSA